MTLFHKPHLVQVYIAFRTSKKRVLTSVDARILWSSSYRHHLPERNKKTLVVIVTVIVRVVTLT